MTASAIAAIYDRISPAVEDALPLVERLTAGGDFRKYVFVLPSVLGVGRRLTERTDLGTRIRMVSGSFEAIPVRAATFTQIWSVEALHHAGDRRRAIAELHRVLRPGSILAPQAIECADVTADRTEPSTIERSAHDAFLRVLAERSPEAARAWHRAERARDTIEAILRGPEYRTVQLFARRPS